jgi:hypothetical protein
MQPWKMTISVGWEDKIATAPMREGTVGIPSSRFGKDPVFPIRTRMRSFILAERLTANFSETIAKNLDLSGEVEL